MPTDRVNILVPGDYPPQIADSPQLQRLTGYGDVTVHRDRPQSSDEKISRAKDFEIIINSRTAVAWRERELRALPKLRMIALCSIGTDMIDLSVARELGIVVSNLPGKTAAIVAEHIFGLMMALAKDAATQTAELKAGRWTRPIHTLLSGKVLGILGAGNIGAAMARLARAIGMKVIAWTFHPSEARARELGVEFVPLEKLLRVADVVSLHVRLSDQTQAMIGHKELEQMKPGALLLNGSRGKVVDIDALAEALHAGRLGGAALDVFPEEPFVSDHPILACDRVVFTPHSADQTPEGVELLNEGAVDSVIAFLAGRPQNNVAV